MKFLNSFDIMLLIKFNYKAYFSYFFEIICMIIYPLKNNEYVNIIFNNSMYVLWGY